MLSITGVESINLAKLDENEYELEPSEDRDEFLNGKIISKVSKYIIYKKGKADYFFGLKVSKIKDVRICKIESPSYGQTYVCYDDKDKGEVEKIINK